MTDSCTRLQSLWVDRRAHSDAVQVRLLRKFDELGHCEAFARCLIALVLQSFGCAILFCAFALRVTVQEALLRRTEQSHLLQTSSGRS